MKKNQLIENFIKENNIDKEILEDTKINDTEKISYVIEKNGFHKNPQNESICIADIIGDNINGNETNNLLKELQSLFSENKGNKYNTRSNSMLKYTSDNIVQGLIESFSKEPISLAEVKKNKYVIKNNGRHRCALLKAHYLKELSKCKNEVDKQNLKSKYTIPVEVERLDVIKTYSKYLLKLTQSKFYTQEELDKNYIRTGKIVITDNNCNSKTYSDDELVEYVKSIVNKIPENDLKNTIPRLYSKEEYFKEYVEANLRETCIEKSIIEWSKINFKDKEKIVDISREREV
jgi:hypothetical protein